MARRTMMVRRRSPSSIPLAESAAALQSSQNGQVAKGARAKRGKGGGGGSLRRLSGPGEKRTWLFRLDVLYLFLTDKGRRPWRLDIVKMRHGYAYTCM